MNKDWNCCGLVGLAERVTDPLADARGSDREGGGCGLVGLACKVAAPLADARGSDTMLY